VQVCLDYLYMEPTRYVHENLDLAFLYIFLTVLSWISLNFLTLGFTVSYLHGELAQGRTPKLGGY
jgi:hypothetical protein